MSIPPTPFPGTGQDPNWANQLINAITDRDALTQAEVDALTTLVDSGRLSQAALQDAYAARTTVDTLQTLVDDGRLSETALADEFAARSHTHPIGQVDGLSDALDGKQPAGQYVAEGDPRLSDAREPLAHRHPLGDLDGTGPTGLALLATALPADARDTLGITVDTSVGTRVFVGDVMVHGDTGWRDVTGDLEGGWFANQLAIRRDGYTVHLRGRQLDGREAESQILYVLPAGFRMGSTQDATASLLQYTSNIANAATWGVRGGSAGRYVGAQSDTGRGDLGGSLSFLTTEPWPSSLPGAPA